MTKYTFEQLTEIKRIKEEYYCGTARALWMYKKVQKARDRADALTELLRGTRYEMGAVPFGAVPFLELRVSIYRRQGIFSTSPAEFARYCVEMLRDSNSSVIFDLVGMFHPGDPDNATYTSGLENEISLVEGGEYTLISGHCSDGKSPLHMRNPNYDTLYLRMREEDTLHHHGLQCLFLARTSSAIRARTLEDVTDFFKHTYDNHQKVDKKERELVKEEIVQSLEQQDALLCEAAAYGLGLLSRNDIRSWLKKYLKS